MRITTKLVLDIETGTVLERESYEYEGPIEKCCGGDSLAPQKTAEANSQVALNNQLTSMMKQYSALSTPFWTSQLQNGLPFFNQLTDFNKGTLAQSMAPEKAALNRNLSGFGSTLPSGFKEQANENFDAAEGSAFDNQMVSALMANNQAKQQAATELNPLAPAAAASGAASSVLGAPPVNSGGIGNFIGGAVSGLLGGSSLGGTTGGMSWAI